MTDKQKTLLWLAPLIVCIVAAVVWKQAVSRRNLETINLLMNVGLDLMRDGYSDKIVPMGEATKAEIAEVRARSQPTWQIQLGDAESPIGNGRADACLIFSSAGVDLLGLRMKIDGDRCHIVGYWTPIEGRE